MSRTPPQPPHEAKLIEPDEATEREVLHLWRQVDHLARQGKIPTIRAGSRVPPQDEDGGRGR